MPKQEKEPLRDILARLAREWGIPEAEMLQRGTGPTRDKQRALATPHCLEPVREDLKEEIGAAHAVWLLGKAGWFMLRTSEYKDVHHATRLTVVWERPRGALSMQDIPSYPSDIVDREEERSRPLEDQPSLPKPRKL